MPRVSYKFYFLKCCVCHNFIFLVLIMKLCEIASYFWARHGQTEKPSSIFAGKPAYEQFFILQKMLVLRRDLEKAMAPHSITLAWKIPWTEEPGGLQSMGSRRVRHDWVTFLSLFTFMHWRRKWQPTPVFLPGESQGQGAWWAAVYGVAQSRTRLKWLSSSSSSKVRSGFPGGSVVKNLPAMQELQETWVWFLGWEYPLKEEMATHSRILPGESHGWRSLVGYSI